MNNYLFQERFRFLICIVLAVILVVNGAQQNLSHSPKRSPKSTRKLEPAVDPEGPFIFIPHPQFHDSSSPSISPKLTIGGSPFYYIGKSDESSASSFSVHNRVIGLVIAMVIAIQ